MSLTLQAFIGRPFFQAIFFILLSLVILPFARSKDANSVYTIAGILFAFFIITNCGMVCFVPKVWPYFFYSMLFSLAYLLIIAIIVPAYISLMKIEGSGESGMIFLIILYHPVLLLVMIFLKWIYLKLF
jgi:hypothetical protein